MKKIIKRLSFLLLAVFVLAACSIEGEDKGKTEENIKNCARVLQENLLL